MERKYKVELELTAGEMGAVLRSLQRGEVEEFFVSEQSPEWSRLCDAFGRVRSSFADALCGVYEERRWGRCLDLVYAWKNRGLNYRACNAAANVRLGEEVA